MIDFLAELIDRNQNNSKDEIENQVRKEKRSKQLGHLLRQSNSDIMVLFYQLRTNVRIQLSFKEDYEMQLKSIIHQKQDALEDENKLLSNQLLQCQAQFEACNLRLQQELESARQMKDSMEISTRDKMERNSVEMENLKASWESTKAQFVQEAQSEKELLERQLKEKQQHVLKLEASLGEIQQSSRRDTVAFFQDPKKNRIQDKANAVDQKKQQFTNNKILAENERLKQHNQRLKQKIQGMYHNATFLQLSTMSKKMDQVNKNEQHLKSQIKDLHEQLREQKQQQAEQQVSTNKSIMCWIIFINIHARYIRLESENKRKYEHMPRNNSPATDLETAIGSRKSTLFFYFFNPTTTTTATTTNHPTASKYQSVSCIFCH